VHFVFFKIENSPRLITVTRDVIREDLDRRAGISLLPVIIIAIEAASIPPGRIGCGARARSHREWLADMRLLLGGAKISAFQP
jgi:hypothetical protein